MRYSQIQIWLRWVWITATLAGLAWYLINTEGRSFEALHSFSPYIILISTSLIILSKFGLAENAFLAAQLTNVPIGRLAVYRVYNFSQLAKYIPGSVWQYVIRGSEYRFAGATYFGAGSAFAIETTWVLCGAAIIGVSLAGPEILVIADEFSLYAPLLAFISIAILIVILSWTFFWEHLQPLVRKAAPGPRIIFLQLITWVVLGLAFAILIPGIGGQIPILFSVGLFALSYIFGFVAFFAPAGLGVREGIQVIGLSLYIPAEQALMVAVLARLVYLLAELIISAGFFLAGPGSAIKERGI